MTSRRQEVHHTTQVSKSSFSLSYRLPRDFMEECVSSVKFCHRRKLLSAQIAYCVQKGVKIRSLHEKYGGNEGTTMQHSGSNRVQNSSNFSEWLQQCYYMSLPYAGSAIELQVVLYAGSGEDEESDEDDEEIPVRERVQGKSENHGNALVRHGHIC